MTEASAPFGRFLKELRSSRGWKQDDVVERTGWDQAKVSRLERGKALPRFEDLEKIAAVFGVPMAKLVRIRKRAA